MHLQEIGKWDQYYAGLPLVDSDDASEEFNRQLANCISEFAEPSDRLLEAGCGGGWQSLELARTGRFRMTLMDFSTKAIEYAARVFKRAGQNADFVEGDVFEPGKPEFDVVFNSGVLEHYTFDEQVSFLRGMASRSRRYVLVMVPNSRCYWYWLWRLHAAQKGQWPWGKEVPMTDLSAAMRAAGINFLGQTVMGESWTEIFIQGLAGIDDSMAKQILAIHRSPALPLDQKGYIIAALGSVVEVPPPPPRWNPKGVAETFEAAEIRAALVDSMALCLAQQRENLRISDLASRKTERLQQFDELQAKLAERERETSELRRQAESRLSRINALEAGKLRHTKEARKLHALNGEYERRFESAVQRYTALGTAFRAREDLILALRNRLTLQGSYLDGLRDALRKQSGPADEELASHREPPEAIHAPGPLPQYEGFAKRGLAALQPLVPEIIRRLVRPVYLPLYKRAFPPPPEPPAQLRPEPAPLPVPPDELSDPIPEVTPPPDIHETLTDLLANPLPGRLKAGWHPLVSVVLPVWNNREYLASSVRSVLEQTYPNIELIVVDDGSDEDLAPVLEGFISDPKITVVRRPHQGLPATLSAGFRAASGEFLSWTSSDNTMAPDMIATLMQFMLRRPDVDMTYGNMELIGSGGNPLVNSDYRLPCQVPGDTSKLLLPTTVETLGVVPDNFIGGCFLYRAAIRRVVGDYDEALLGTEDYDYWLRIAALGSIAHVDSDRMLYQYRVHEKTLSSRHTPKIAQNAVSLIAYHRERLHYFRRPFRILLVRNREDRLLFQAGGQLAAAFGQHGHRVEMFDENSEPTSPLYPALASLPREEKAIVIWLASADPRVIEGLSPLENVMLVRFPPGPDAPPVQPTPESQWFLCESQGHVRRLPASHAANWSYFAPSRILLNDEERLLNLKGRDHNCSLWDLPDLSEPLVLYIGRYLDPLIDWEFLQTLVDSNPNATFAFLSTSEGDRIDPRSRLGGASNVVNLGPKSHHEWYRYLSRASLLLAPFVSGEDYARHIQDSLLIYLAAGKPVLAASGIRSTGLEEAPNVLVSSRQRVARDFPAALDMEPGLPAADRYLQRRSIGGIARTIVGAANSRLFFRNTRRRSAGHASPTSGAINRRPRCLVETKTLDAGGLEQVVVDFSQALRTRDIDVAIMVTERQGRLADVCRQDGTQVEFTGTSAAAIQRMFDQFNPDIVVPHYADATSRLAWKAGVPVLGFVHNAYIWHTPEADERIRQCDLFVSRYVAVSEWVKRYFTRKYNVSERKIEVIPNGTDIGRFADGSSGPEGVGPEGVGPEGVGREGVGRASLGIAGDGIVLLNVGSLFGTKSQLHAIRVLSLLQSDCPRLHLLIVASGKDPQYETLLHAAVSRYGLHGRVTFCERTSRIGDYYRLADAVLMPSITEGWSLAMNESMFFELPMVLTDVGGASEALRLFKGGVIVPAAYADPLTLGPRSLFELAANPDPPNLPEMVEAVRDLYHRIDYWKDRARGGKKLVLERFSSDAVGDRYARTILDALWRHSGRESDLLRAGNMIRYHHGDGA